MLVSSSSIVYAYNHSLHICEQFFIFLKANMIIIIPRMLYNHVSY